MANDSWTIETLKEFIEQRFDLTDKLVDAANHSAAVAVQKAEAATEKHFAAVNEFRESLNDMVTRLVTRVEVEAMVKGLEDKLNQFMRSSGERMDEARNAALAQHNWSMGVVASLFVGILAFIAAMASLWMRGK